jgi:hypothetical protein
MAVAELLMALVPALSAEVAALPPALASWHPRAGEWCVNEVIGHLIEAERRGFAGRIRIILARTDPQLQTWDQDEVARARHDCEREPAAVLDELVVLRRTSVGLVRDLHAQDLARGGYHPAVGYLRVADLLHEWVHHDRNHFRQILANVQAAVWPHMGNAQKFSIAGR